MYSIDLTDIFLFIDLSQGLFLAISLQIIPNKNKDANRVLSLLLLIAVLMLIGRVAYDKFNSQWLGYFGFFGDTTIFLFGPLLYSYARRLLYNEDPLFKLRIVHYIPAFIYLAYFGWYLWVGNEYYTSLAKSGSLNFIYLLTEAVGFISLTFYIILSFIKLQSFKLREKQEIAINQDAYVFLRNVLIVLTVIAMIWGVSIISIYGLGIYWALVNYTTMWIVVPIFIYLIGFYSFRQPEIFRLPYQKDTKEEKDRLKPKEIHLLQKRLAYFMEEEKVFLDSSITLKQLADKLNTSPNNLSWLLNKVFQNSFYEYINQHRINAFIAKVDEGEHRAHTLLALATDVGFNSKSTFNKAFKTITGLTPSAYIKTKKVA